MTVLCMMNVTKTHHPNLFQYLKLFTLNVLYDPIFRNAYD